MALSSPFGSGSARMQKPPQGAVPAAAAGVPGAPDHRAQGGSSFDQQAVDRIMRSRDKHRSLRDKRLIALGEADRLGKLDIENRTAIQSQFGVPDVDGLREWVAARRAAATAEIEEYEARIEAVAQAVDALDAGI